MYLTKVRVNSEDSVDPKCYDNKTSEVSESAFAGKNGRNLSNFAANVTFRDLRGLKFGSTETTRPTGVTRSTSQFSGKPRS